MSNYLLNSLFLVKHQAFGFSIISQKPNSRLAVPCPEQINSNLPLSAIQAEVNQFARIPVTRLEALTRTIAKAKNRRKRKSEGHVGMTMRVRRGRQKSDGKAVKALERRTRSKRTNWVIIVLIQFPKISDQRGARKGRRSTRSRARRARSRRKNRSRRKSETPQAPSLLTKC